MYTTVADEIAAPLRPLFGLAENERRAGQGSTMNGSIMSLSSCSTMWQW
jgi:hypothetical protein